MVYIVTFSNRPQVDKTQLQLSQQTATITFFGPFIFICMFQSAKAYSTTPREKQRSGRLEYSTHRYYYSQLLLYL